MARLTTFIVGMVLIGLFASGFGLLLTEFAYNYDVNYDNTTLGSYNKLATLRNSSETIKNTSSSFTENPSALDIIGGYYSNAYEGMKITAYSFDIFVDMTNEATDDASLGPFGSILNTALITIVIVLIFVGVILAAIIKWYV